MWLLPPELTERVFCMLLVDRTNEAVGGAMLSRDCLLSLPLVCRVFAESFRSAVLWEYVLQRCFFLPPESTAAAMRRTSEFARQACARATSSTCLTWGDWASRGGNEKGGAVQVVHGGPLALLRSSDSSFIGRMVDGCVSIIDVDVLGKGEYSAASVAVAVPSGRIVQIAQTAATCVIVDEHGSAYESPLRAWSREWCTETRADPCTVMERVPLAETFITAVACGDAHTLALSAATGDCFGWGDNSVGQLGDATAPHWSEPRMVAVPMDQGVPCGLAAGHQFSVIRTTAGRVLSCGANTHGQLGRLVSDDGNATRSAFRPIAFENVRLNEAGVSCGTAISAIACGHDFCVCVDETNGLVFSWGNGRDGQLGQGGIKKSVPLPKLVESMTGHGVVDVSCGRNFVAVLTAAGTVWTWGDNRRGQLGRSHKSVVGRQVKSLASVCVSWVYCSHEDCFVICSDRSTMYSLPQAHSPKMKFGSVKTGTNANRSPGGGANRRAKSNGASTPLTSPDQCATQLGVLGPPTSQPDNKLSKYHKLGVQANRCWSDRGWGSAWAQFPVNAQTCTAFFEVRIRDIQGVKRGAKGRTGVVRVGWRCRNAHHELGGCKGSIGFGSTARKSWNGRFQDYGVCFDNAGDVVGCLLSRSGDGACLFMVNGRVQGIAYNLRECGLLSEPLFPAVACKLSEVEVNFGPDFLYPFESAAVLPLSLGEAMCTSKATARVQLHQEEDDMDDSVSKSLLWLPASSSGRQRGVHKPDSSSPNNEDQQSYSEWVHETMSGDLAPSLCDEFHAWQPQGDESRVRRARKSRAASPHPKPKSSDGPAPDRSSISQTLVGQIQAFACVCAEAGNAPMSMPMSTGMSKAERKFVHHEARRLGLSTISKGQGKSRHCVLLGPNTGCAPTQETMRSGVGSSYVMPHGHETVPNAPAMPEPEPEQAR